MGKFANTADEMAHALSLDGCDEEAGTVEYGPGWAGLVRLGNDEARVIAGCIGGPDFVPHAAIVHEDSQGFVSVDYFADEAEAVAAWEVAEAERAEADDE